jgi:hypothetical protein
MPLIDKFLPVYDVNEIHSIEVKAPIKNIYKAVKNLDISKAKLTKTLFSLRALSYYSSFTVEDIYKVGFALLGEKLNEEIVFGLIGKFWTISGNIHIIDAKSFNSFEKAGYAKTVWNFSLENKDENIVKLKTETRVYCTDDSSRRKFKLYWFFIGQFSAITRKEILRVIKNNVESFE